MAVGTALVLAAAGPASAHEGEVTLCHATGSGSNPFVVITVDSAGAYNGHYGGDHQNGEDIIPPFEWKGQTYSQNWTDAGQKIHQAGCTVAATTTTPAMTTTPATTTSSHPDEGKVTLCHATGSESNPYVVIEVAAAGAYNGHLGNSHQNGEDIIPPFQFQGQTYSQHWDSAGQAIFKNGCAKLAAGTSTPATSTPATSTPATSTSATSTSAASATSTTSTPATSTSVAGTSRPNTSQATTTSAAQRAAGTTPRRTAGPIPGAVSAGVNETSSWQLPVGGALIALGALGTISTIARRSSAKR
jgi:hypothetical protein